MPSCPKPQPATATGDNMAIGDCPLPLDKKMAATWTWTAKQQYDRFLAISQILRVLRLYLATAAENTRENSLSSDSCSFKKWGDAWGCKRQGLPHLNHDLEQKHFLFYFLHYCRYDDCVLKRILFLAGNGGVASWCFTPPYLTKSLWKNY